MSVANGSRSAGQDWVEIIGRKSLDAFAAAFTVDAVLEASVLDDPVKGPSGIRSVFSATAAIYETIVFTHETTQGSKTYLEWEGKALGGRTAAGVTVLTRNATGKIESVRLMHRPLPMVLAFSAELARRLEGKLDLEPLNHQT
jgi:ketosteroid isomerase-like protein